MSVPASNPVYKSINKPLTVWGVERRLFFVAMILGAGHLHLLFEFVGRGPDVRCAVWLRTARDRH